MNFRSYVPRKNRNQHKWAPDQRATDKRIPKNSTTTNTYQRNKPEKIDACKN